MVRSGETQKDVLVTEAARLAAAAEANGTAVEPFVRAFYEHVPPADVVSRAASAHYRRPNARKPRSPARAPNAILSKCHMSPIDLRLQFDHGARVAVQKNNRCQYWFADR